MAQLTPEVMPACTMKRVIVHWSGGAYRASPLDRTHYHILIEGDGKVVAGTSSILQNAAPAREPRASHTLNCNTASIGVAVCCMAGARERPFTAGQFPMTQQQWEVMTEVVAELCVRYRIDVTAATVLAHGEVQATLGIQQRQKWDPLVLPWAPTMPRPDVMERFRSRVREHVARLRGGDEFVISDIQPPLTRPGGTIAIRGGGFGAAQGGASVRFNGVPAGGVDRWTDTEIEARVPDDVIGATQVELVLEDGTRTVAAADRLMVTEV